ncbi:hypothetical protein BB559_006763 [Furculomyces boomerangus]|uniref:Uncharacterized protein n=2 Tax=Harpellales TaxID=61421 RepID=A0A2T9Y0M3_9FUNG|nr:hypothetical protein BB559_006763 [Furculomyces boomerangus]
MSHYVDITESTKILKIISQKDVDTGMYCIDHADMMSTSMNQTVLAGYFQYVLNATIPMPQISSRCLLVQSGDFISARKVNARYGHDNTTISYITTLPQISSWDTRISSQLQDTITYPSG